MIAKTLKLNLNVICCVVAMIVVVTFVVGLNIEHAKFPEMLGNKSDNIEKLQSKVNPENFSFIILGDVKDSMPTFESLLDIAELENPSFIIILGDLVNHSTSISHKLFAYEISDYASKMHFLILPGNHDINTKSGFGLYDFEDIYGPSQFYFTVGSNLFIFLNDLPEFNQNDEYLNFLEDTLKNNQQENQKVFVFTHIPPSGLSNLLKCSAAPNSKRFVELARKYHVDYVFAGDHHGYIKTQKDGTAYIVTGGGGARLRGAKGKFHHFVEINSENGKISENVISVKHKNNPLELLERNIIEYLWQSIKQHKIIYISSIVYCGIIALTFFFLNVAKFKTEQN